MEVLAHDAHLLTGAGHVVERYTLPAAEEAGLSRVRAGAKAVWKRVMAEMATAEVIFAADSDVLRCYCEAVSQYQSSMRTLASSSPLVRYRDGLVKNPLHQIVRDDRDAVRLFARELGLSPSGRAGLNVEMGGAVGDIEEVIGPAPRRLHAVGGSDG